MTIDLFNSHEPPAPDGLCAQTDPEIFFPEKGQPSPAAKRVCARCPSLARCKSWILALEAKVGLQPGIYAGLTESERRKLHVRKCREADCPISLESTRAQYCDEHALVARRRSQAAYEERRGAPKAS